MMGIISSLFGRDKHLEVDKESALDLIGEDAIVIDVRNEKQRNKVEAIFDENIHIEFKEFETRIKDLLEKKKLAKDDSYVVFCTTGAKGLKAVKILRNYGFKKSFNMKYGTNAWHANDNGCGT
jgi:rhodanese-related sulfurtransferase